MDTMQWRKVFPVGQFVFLAVTTVLAWAPITCTYLLCRELWQDSSAWEYMQFGFTLLAALFSLNSIIAFTFTSFDSAVPAALAFLIGVVLWLLNLPEPAALLIFSTPLFAWIFICHFRGRQSKQQTTFEKNEKRRFVSAFN